MTTPDLLDWLEYALYDELAYHKQVSDYPPEADFDQRLRAQVRAFLEGRTDLPTARDDAALDWLAAQVPGLCTAFGLLEHRRPLYDSPIQ